MNDNPLKQLEQLGQSVWLDYIRRDMLNNGELLRLIKEDGLSGMTSNPAIFEKAITGSQDYDGDIQAMAHESKGAQEIYEAISQSDVQKAADAFRPLYDETGGKDGYVSLEVNPHLAHDTHGTLEEARRLWAALGRPNVLIKVPGTAEGLPAIQQLLSEGINVNVTLLFGLPRYRQVAEAYLAGLEARHSLGQALDHVASVASFFVSRIDSYVDPLLAPILAKAGGSPMQAREAQGQVAIASAKVAYLAFKESFDSPRFQVLAKAGARVQRLLWASTGTKNPAYSDVKYVETLIGQDTITTIPVDTLKAFRAHGVATRSLDTDAAKAETILNHLAEVGIDLDQVTQHLEDEGVEKFNKPFDTLMEALTKKANPALTLTPVILG